jgi:hypothetical protein
VDWLLQEWRAGRVEPLPVRLPNADLDAKAQAVADFYAVVRGLRLPVDHLPDPVLFGCGWVAGHLGMPKMTVWRALRTLEATGVLTRAESLYSGKGHQTDTYMPGDGAT